MCMAFVADTKGKGVEFRLLGPVEAVVDGHALPLGGRRQRALLALLLLEPGRTVSSDRLVEELWLGSPPAGADKTLRSYVSRLRRTLGPGTVVTRAGGYAITVDPGRLDVHRFVELQQQGRDALARDAAGVAGERLHAALSLWRGRALADVCDGGSLSDEARRLDELRLDCLEERLEADLALGRHATLVPELRALVQDEPLRERFQRQLVLALYRCGRQADALAAYRAARRLLDAELGLEPGEELKELERAILRHEVAAVPDVEARHNLPARATSFVGRERELAELERLLRERRLITLTGMGGSGKTRLALEAAGRQVDVWPAGVWLVELTALADPGLVPGAVVETLGVAEGSDGGTLERLLGHLRTLELLLVLDNCEHLVEACAAMAEALVRECPHVSVLATSRVPLGVEGELDYLLDPFGVPGEGVPDAELEQSPAVRLFLERAATVRRVAGEGPALATVAAICRELDGLPLAIELAAARAKALSPAEIAARLDDRFRFLRAWQRVADPRHRTLQTTMDWSYELLAESEQELLRRLSVFAGGADVEAVAAVCLGGDEDTAVELLGRLVDASLVVAEPGERTRYRLLETVRQYAAGKLGQDAAADDVRRRHADHYLHVAEAANLSVASLGKGPQRAELVLAEQHNLRAAMNWAVSSDVELGLRIALALENFWVVHATSEGERRYEQLLARAEGVDPLVLVGATRDYAACLDVQGKWPAARAQYERSGELARRAGDAAGMAHAKFRLGVVGYHDRDLAYVRRQWEECLETFRAIGDHIGELQAIGNLGGIEWDEGNREPAVAMIEQALEMAQEIGWVWWQVRALSDLAEMALEQGKVDDAERHARAYLAIASETANRQETLYALAMLARAAALRGDDARALRLWSSVEAVEDTGGRFGQFDRREFAAAMPDLPRPAPLPLDEAVALALASS
jgi:predicted ATPase/DNA-binding SARP family transcriptional activator